jgi:hypothetical protein
MISSGIFSPLSLSRMGISSIMISPLCVNVMLETLTYGKRWEDTYGEKHLVLLMLLYRMIA